MKRLLLLAAWLILAAPALAEPATPAGERRAPAPRAPAMPRTLSDVHIEGELPVPQVWFITARDQRRYVDFQHHRFLSTSTQLGKDTPFPVWAVVIHDSPFEPRKEPSR